MLRRRLLAIVPAALAGSLLARAARAQPAAARPAGAPRRYALVIGNARYADVPLNNPTNDAELIARTLEGLGFEVTLGLNLRRADFLQALLQFAKNVPAGADAVFYYAGHAVQIRGGNYLLPVDIRNLGDADWVEQNAISLDGSVIRQLLQREGGAGVRLLFIDACRDSPFAPGANRVAALTAGMASVQNSAIDSGVLISSASQPNKPAEDGPPGGNSIYTAALAREMAVPGQNVESMLKNVTKQVARDSREAQVPMIMSSLTTEFVFNAGRGAASAAPVQLVQPARSLQITVRADRALNSDTRSQPRKSVLWVYVLRATAAFEKAGFEALYERAEATLGADLLAREKLNLSPGESYPLPLDLASTARAIGVLVAYREPDGEGWKALLPIGTGAAGGANAPLPVRIDAGARSVRIALAGG